MEHLGIYGPVVFVATVIGAEMVPLFPTQPLSIASGLLFGTSKVKAARKRHACYLSSTTCLGIGDPNLTSSCRGLYWL